VFFQAGGEWCFLRTPPGYRASPAQGNAVPCVIHCHGNRGYVRDGEAEWLDDENRSVFLRTLVDAGIAVSGSHATGNHWGTPSAVAANAALYDALVGETNVDSARMGLMGGGLGGALVWNSATGPLAGKIRAAVLQQAVLSHDSIVRNHKFKDQLLEAYGIPADAPDDLAISSLAYNDPLNRTRLLASQNGAKTAALLPEVLFVHGDMDENILFKENPIPLSKELDAIGGAYSFQTYQGVGHATYDLGERAAKDITDFFKRTFTL
ncbi:MAG: prolyl oligopeptidase family serine peptidase, partial [Chloroflexi bacterium]|nr:prolyl oligopeptidase family serine peptidase [Chloroflexota bacterium]